MYSLANGGVMCKVNNVSNMCRVISFGDDSENNKHVK